MASRLILALLLAFLAAPLVGEAPAVGRLPLVGYVFARRASEDYRTWEEARRGLRELGYVEGKNIALEVRWAEGRSERLSGLVAEMVDLKVDILVVATTPGALAAKNVTRTLPVVFLVVADPVGSGVVVSLARPGGNVTGLSLLSPETSGKRLELLKNTLPHMSRVAVIMNSGNRMHPVFWKETQAAAQKLRLQLQSIQLQAAEGVDDAIQAAVNGRADALVVFDDPLLISHRARLVALATQRRLPMIAGLREFAETGGLLSYGASFLEQYRRTAIYVDKILKGAKPADLPVEQPTKFELIINRRTAKALGLTIPQSMLARADELIE